MAPVCVFRQLCQPSFLFKTQAEQEQRAARRTQMFVRVNPLPRPPASPRGSMSVATEDDRLLRALPLTLLVTPPFRTNFIKRYASNKCK